MVPHCHCSNKTPLENGEMKYTNLLNPQVASTDKYGNDFLFFSPASFTREMLSTESEGKKGSSL